MNPRFRHSLLLSLLVSAALVPGRAFAKGPVVGGPEILNPATGEATVARGNLRIGVESGVPRTLYNVGYAVRAGAPEVMARQYLSENRALLRLADPALADLVLRATRPGRAGTTVRFAQHVQGIPVLAPDVAVTIDASHRVTYVTNGYQPGLEVTSIVPSVTDAAARSAALARLAVTGPLAFESNRLVVVPSGKQARLAWQVQMVPAVSPIGDWEVLVDARSGEVFRVEDRSLHVDGTGYVFDPDPLSAAHTSYGAAGFSDGADATTPQLDAARVSRTLPSLTDLGGGTFKLQGPYAEVVDSEAPFKGLFTQAGSTFNFDRSQDAFEAVNAYYHIDQIMRYVNVTLGIPVVPYQYVGGVRFDPSGFNGADNSHYTSSTGQLAFGEGGVDDAEDADVVIHELGHGLHDWLTAGSLSQVDGLSEGVGDYVAQSYSRSLGQWASNETPFQWVFNWDGHNEFWPGRITNYGALYPGGLVGEVHSDGQIWATCLMKIWDDVGRARTDAAVFEGLAMTNSGSSQNDAAQAVLQAAVALGYTSAEINSFVTHFRDTGYTVSVGIDYLSNSVTDQCPSDGSHVNAILEPGETADLVVTVKASSLGQTGAVGTLTTSTPGITILDGTATWPALAPGVPTASDAPHFRISVDGSVACYSSIAFQLSITSDQGGPYVSNFTRAVGFAPAPTGMPVAIPDNSPAGITNTFNVLGNVTLSDVNVRVKIDHSWVGDVYIKLRSPLGTEVVLLDRPGYAGAGFGCGTDNMDVTFDDAASIVPETWCANTNPWLSGPAKPFTPLSAFNGQSTPGNWVLTVEDLAAADVGTLITWELQTTPALPGTCSPCQSLVAAPLPGNSGGRLDAVVNRPNPFRHSTEIAFRLAQSGHATLRIYDVAGQVMTTLLDGEMTAGPHTMSWDGRDGRGATVPAGIYFYRLASGLEHGERRMLLVR
jgi:hypothetical protein